jgi:hypothetical protein
VKFKYELRDKMPFLGHWRYIVACYADCHRTSQWRRKNNIPLPHILKGWLLISPPAKEVPTLKRRMPLNATSEDEGKLLAT